MRLRNRFLDLQPPSKVQPWLWRGYRRLSGLDHLADLYRKLPQSTSSGEFAAAALRAVGVSHQTDAAELAEVPQVGPVVIVANHPFGGIDGLAAIATLHARRHDLKVLATTALRCALRHVEHGGALLIYPAGKVSSRQLSIGCIVDAPWKKSALNF